MTNTPKPQANKTIDDYTHYYRVCTTCGYGWWGLHCPHDGYQNNCGNCNTRPTILPGDLCKCEFVAEVDEIQALINEKVIEGKIALLEEIKPPEQFKDYMRMAGYTNGCAVCGFNSETFREFLSDRIDELKKELTDDPR